MLRYGLSLIILGWLGVVVAEEGRSGTEKSIVGGINFTQTGFDNWVSGGESAFAWQVNLIYKFVQDRENVTWANAGKLAYGATKQGEAELRKSTDELKIESVLTYQLGSSINPFVALTGESQFAEGYNYGIDPNKPISAFMNPGYFRESFGVGFDVKKGVSTRLGLALKQTISEDYAEQYTDDLSTVEIETFRNEAGLESVSDISLKISETAQLVSKLEIFSNFNGVDETDVNFDNTLTVEVSKYINMNINVKLIYDKDLSVKRQIKQAMALGLNYTFI